MMWQNHRGRRSARGIQQWLQTTEAVSAGEGNFGYLARRQEREGPGRRSIRGTSKFLLCSSCFCILENALWCIFVNSVRFMWQGGMYKTDPINQMYKSTVSKLCPAISVLHFKQCFYLLIIGDMKDKDAIDEVCKSAAKGTQTIL